MRLHYLFIRPISRFAIPSMLIGMLSFSALTAGKQADVDTLVTIMPYKSASFNPTRNENFIIPITVTSPQTLKTIAVEIRTHDDDLIRRLETKTLDVNEKDYQFLWDGKDSNKQLVPDEVYYPIVVINNRKGVETRIDQRDNSGGEEVYDFEKRIIPKAIEYTLPVASRLLIRAGIKNGPLLRTVVDWEPRTTGFHTERWNGRDADNVITIDQNPQVGYLIVGYQLPEHTIIAYGNSKETYRDYRERLQWPIKKTNYENRLLARGDQRIRSEFYTPVLQQKSPRIIVNLLEKASRKPVSSITGFEEVLTEIQLHSLDEVYLDQQRYEITFFVDNEFIAEEEQGFVPFTWRWSPGRFGIKPGEHLLTVNVSGYNGQVGVKNIPFTLIADKEKE